MHLIIPIIIQFYLFPIILNSDIVSIENSTEDAVQIEILNEKSISFDFSMKYTSRREQIHIRSSVPIQSLRIRSESDKQKEYDVRGSSLIMLPKSDFTPGRYLAELKFQKDPTVVLANIEVMESLKPSDL